MLVVERFLLRPSSKFNQVIMLVLGPVFPSLISSQFVFVRFMKAGVNLKVDRILI
jgi:hypothetical protein